MLLKDIGYVLDETGSVMDGDRAKRAVDGLTAESLSNPIDDFHIADNKGNEYE